MSANPQDEQPAKADPFARAKPPPGAMSDDDEAEFGQSLAAKALAFASQAPPWAGGTPAAPAAPAAPAPAAAAPRAAESEPAVRIPGSPAAPSATAAGDDDEIFGGANLAAAALKFASQAPPRAGSVSSVPAPAPVAPASPAAPRRSIDEPPPLERSTPAKAPVRLHGSAGIPDEPPPLHRAGATAASQSADGECRIAVTRDGFKELWDVVFPGGGGAVIILTPRRSYPGDARVLAAHISWRAADAVATAHATSFARVLAKAASQAETLPPATLS